jgi:lipoprotein-releasing system permease protein
VYKLILCWRYLLTRYLALACIISVMLGVATLIVVNSVMAGFSAKLRDRLHGLLSDVVIECVSYHGFRDPNGHMALLRNDPFLKDKIESMTATMEIFAMMQFEFRGETITRPVHVIGVEPESRAKVGGFSEYLLRQKDNPKPNFEPDDAIRKRMQMNNPPVLGFQDDVQPLDPNAKPDPDPPPEIPVEPHGIFIGYALGHVRMKDAHADIEQKDLPLLELGDEVVLLTASGAKLAPVTGRFTVVDFIKTEMSEYDGNYVFVSLEWLQHLRTMHDRATGIQIRLKDNRDAIAVRDHLRQMEQFPREYFQISTWEDKQGPLLGAIAIEKGLLNILLFLIIAVAGFGILAIFTMIVSEKTRDIGILKALGASSGGVMQIFLGYGLLLGMIGALLGTGVGLGLTYHINNIEKALSHWTGADIFPRDIYYFDRIPTDVQWGPVLLVNAGALLIAVLFSVFPALRAAMLHPVRALRYE